MKPREWNELAENYHKEIVSPLRKGVDNPLFAHLKNVKNSKDISKKYKAKLKRLKES